MPKPVKHPPPQQRKRYLAVVYDRTGYALDYYPNERAQCWLELGPWIVGDFKTEQKALDQVKYYLENRLTKQATERKAK